jgi:8-oxo-dGTP pyrophosphatase MutT (NUDIX family)
MRAASGAPPGTPAPPTEQLLARFPVLRPPVATAGAAVTIVLREGSTDVETLLIERAENPEDLASGEVALPGGHVDEGDGTLASTALRELREEVGLAATDLDGPLHFVGSTPARRFGIHVGVFAARLGPRAGPPTVANPREVAHVFWLPRGALSESRPLTRETERGALRILATVHEGHIVWGFTRRVLRDFFDLPVEDVPQGPAFSDRSPEDRARAAEDASGSPPRGP